MTNLYLLSLPQVQLFVGVGVLFALPITTALAMRALYYWHTKG